MDILFKALAAALLATFVIAGAGQAFLKTNDLRNYPNIKVNAAASNRVTGMADAAPGTAAAQQADPSAPKTMSKGEEEAAKSGFSTELENPNQ
jgi:hypothetical protein